MLGWRDAAFLEGADDWIHRHAGVVGPIEQTHVEFWSTVLRVPATDGVLWFKAPDDPTEATLTALLASEVPAWTPELVAVDETRGWMLIRDAGARLRELLDDDPDLRHWEIVLGGCAELQLAMAGHADELLAAGVTDFRPGVLPAMVSALLDADEYLMLDEPEGLASGDRDALRAELPTIATMCDELASAGIPDTVQHDDLNDGNVYLKDGRYRIIDWGDACISQPFHTLTVALRSIAYRLSLEPGGPEILRVRDAYLEPFHAYGSRRELIRLADIAYRTGILARSLAWQSYVAIREPDDRRPDLEAVPYGLRKFLEHGPLGDWR